MSNDHLTLIQFVIDHAPNEPVRRRIAIYRSLANLCGSVDESKRLTQIAAELEAAEQRCSEFAFDFKRALATH